MENRSGLFGQRDVLVQMLLERVGEMPAVSLRMESVRALIARAKPLIASFCDSLRITPAGGKGLPVA